MKCCRNGFSLVELLIAISLVSLVMLGLLGALRSFGDTGTRLERRSAQFDELRLVSAFLRETLSSASPRVWQRPPSVSSETYFLGSTTALHWLGAMPARHGAGGISYIKVEPTEEGRVLELSLLPFDPLEQAPAWERAETSWLVEELEEVRFSYQPFEGGEWLSEWRSNTHLPGRVMIEIVAAGRAWPPLIIPVWAAMPGAQVP